MKRLNFKNLREVVTIIYDRHDQTIGFYMWPYPGEDVRIAIGSDGHDDKVGGISESAAILIVRLVEVITDCEFKPTDGVNESQIVFQRSR